MVSTVAELLTLSPLFGDFDDRQRERIAGRFSQRRLRRGQLLFAAGDPAEHLVLVVSGRLKVTSEAADGRELVLTTAGQGEFIGEVGLFDHGVRSATVSATEDSTVALLPRADAVAVVRANPELAEQLLSSLAAVVRRLTGSAADLVFLDLPRRVAKLLCEHSSSVGGRVVFDLSDSQSELAHRVGGSRQAVNTALRGFARRGWVEQHGPRLTIKDRVALARFAGVEDTVAGLSPS